MSINQAEALRSVPQRQASGGVQSRAFSTRSGRPQLKLMTQFDCLLDEPALGELDAYYASVRRERLTLTREIDLANPKNRRMLLYLESFFHPDLAFFDGLTSDSMRTLDGRIELFRDFSVFRTNAFAFRGDALVGYIMAGEQRGVNYVSSIIVHPSHRGCIGGQLYNSIANGFSNNLPQVLSTWYLSGRNNGDIDSLGHSAHLYSSPVPFWLRQGFRHIMQYQMHLFDAMRPYYESIGREINPEFENGSLAMLRRFYRNGWDGTYMTHK